MKSIRENCGIWARGTFEEMLPNVKDLIPRVRADTLRCFNNLEISTKRVDGYACERLPKTDEDVIGVGINYTDVFHELYDKGTFTPVHYLAELVGRYTEKRGYDNRLEGFIARGLRTLTSLLREPDFAELIINSMLPLEQSTAARLNPKQDVRDHTDVLLSYKGDTYRIWLFQFSDRGLPHDIERVTGRRGELPSGIHVLCPLKTEYAFEHERIENKYQRIKRRISAVREELADYSEQAVKTRKRLTDRLVTLNHEKTELESNLQNIAKRTATELDIVEGWYFYSASHVERIANLIKSGKEVHAYNKVVKTLLAAEDFLSETRIFKK